MTKPQIDIIRLYDAMNTTFPASSASAEHQPKQESDWLSQPLFYSWSDADMAAVLSQLGIETDTENVAGLLENIVEQGHLGKILGHKNNISYGVTEKGLSAWYGAKQKMKEAELKELHEAIMQG
jgi:hypothetical protein